MEHQELLPHLFRNEYSRITAVLCKTFGLDNIEMAEDIASDAFLAALEVWTFQGIPENPVAWLHTVAKNKTRNYLLRSRTFSDKVLPCLKIATQYQIDIEPDLSDSNINDSVLQMMFAICHPLISRESQICLALRILCGFGIDEIASALLINKETVNKRLYRAKEILRKEQAKLEIPDNKSIGNRLESVLVTLYLLFNEGYYSETNDDVIREELCSEAIRLVYILAKSPITDLPQVNALLAMMCFHSSRLEARKNEGGGLVLYEDQDPLLWNQELIARGAFYLNKASVGKELSKYHLEASIAWWHTIHADTHEKWQNILQLYDLLIKVNYSPIAHLNQIYAFSKVYGNKLAIIEAEKLNLLTNQYYYVLMGELYLGYNDEKAKSCYILALNLAKTNIDKNCIKEKISVLERLV